MTDRGPDYSRRSLMKNTGTLGAAALMGGLAGCGGSSEGNSDGTSVSTATNTPSSEEEQFSTDETVADNQEETTVSPETVTESEDLVLDYANVTEIYDLNTLLERQEVDAQPLEGRGNGETIAGYLENIEVSHLDEDQKRLSSRVAEIPPSARPNRDIVEEFGTEAKEDDVVMKYDSLSSFLANYNVPDTPYHQTSLELDVGGDTYHLVNRFEVGENGEPEYVFQGRVPELE